MAYELATPAIQSALIARLEADAALAALLKTRPAARGGGPAIYEDGDVYDGQTMPYLTIGLWTQTPDHLFGCFGWTCTGQIKAISQTISRPPQVMSAVLTALEHGTRLDLPGYDAAWIDEITAQPMFRAQQAGKSTFELPIIVRVNVSEATAPPPPPVLPFALLRATTVATGASGATTAAMDTKGATLLLISTSVYALGSVPTDSQGNTWTPLPLRLAPSGGHRFYYAINPLVGSTHTFTMTDLYAAVIVWAFAGPLAPVFHSETGATGGSPLPTGSLTPALDGALIVSGFASNPALTPSVTVGTQTTVPPVNGVNITGAASYLVQPAAAAVNPTWTWTNAPDAAGAVAVFLPGAP